MAKLRVYARNDAGIASARYSSFDVFDGTWHHVAYTETSGQAQLWVDGVRDPASFDDRFGARGTRSPDHGTYGFDKCSLGNVLRPSACCWFQGILDEVAVFGFPLSGADVLALRGGSLPGVCRAGIGEYGVGCGPGPLDLYATGSALLGGPGMVFSARGGRANAAAFLCFGAGAALPRDLGAVGYPGCTLYTPALDTVPLGALSAFGTLPGTTFPIPNLAALACIRVVFQVFDVQGRQADFSNAIVALLGS
jgi:hypothetical protein